MYNAVAASSRLINSYNDSTASATNLGVASNVGPLGTYNMIYHWNMELQTNFTMADTTDYSMEIARSLPVSAGNDP